MTHPELDVLVVGAGPAGLATAVTAARHGARVLLVERRAGLSPHPRATGLSTRTVEILRTWGLEDRVRAAAIDAEPVMAVRRTLADAPLQTVPLGYPTPEQAAPVSPTSALCCPQDHVERVLLRHLIDLGVPVRFGCAVTACAQDAAGVTATFADGSTVRSRFLVGADGARSAVRGMLGIGVDDLGTLAEFLNVQFRAELGTGHPALNVIAGPRPGGLPGEVLLPAGSGRWMYARRGGGKWTRAGLTTAIRTATGVRDLPLTVDAVFPFTMSGALATAFRSGSGFLVGDAAHRMTPMGGAGLNTAVHAAHALGWRLAFAARGLGGDALLAGYEAERRPVGRENVLRSLGRGGAPGDTGGLEHDLGGGLTTATPGARAPHAWVRHDGRRVSTLDLFDGRFTLLTGPTGTGWRAAADALNEAGLPIAALSAGLDLRGDDGRLAVRYGLGADGAVLVRPDGHCGPALGGGNPLRALRAAVETVLGS
jgi:putative polyketide hydroxylase